MGWWGWSWGGTFTLYALTHSDRFRAGVARFAPVTDWRNYDSIYCERYMSEAEGGCPPRATRTDLGGEFSGSEIKRAALAGARHRATITVHIENTVQFIQKLIEAQIPYDLQIYPRKTHSDCRAPDVRTHLYTPDSWSQFGQCGCPRCNDDRNGDEIDKASLCRTCACAWSCCCSTRSVRRDRERVGGAAGRGFYGVRGFRPSLDAEIQILALLTSEDV